MNRLLTNLNESQMKAVTTTSGPLLVIAGAGSGKTRVLTRRLAYILHEQLADPYQILAVTFTNKAAGEMRNRVAALLGGNVQEMNVSTFHSFCARLLRREADQIGYAGSFTIFDESDSRSLIKNCIRELGFAGGQFVPKAQLRKISNAKSHLLSAESFAADASGYFEECTSQIYILYQKRLRECNGMDFDDLLYNAVSLLKDNQKAGQRYRKRFRYLMVDEYQDTNYVQYMLLKSLLGDHLNLCVVGDEDQSIYGWRGADIRNILEFEKDFPGATIIKLEQNYRSTKTILSAASSVIGNNEARKGKTLWSDNDGGEKLKLLLVDSTDDEAMNVVHYINVEQDGTPLKEMAVLYRTNAQSRAFEEQLRRRGLPYQIVGGIAFYQRKEIKDLMAYLKLIANPRDDVSFERVVNYPKRGIGKKTLEQISSLARRNGCSCYELIRGGKENPELSGQWNRLEPFVKLIEKHRVKMDQVPVDILTQELVEDLNLLEELKSEDRIIGQAKIENVEALIEGMTEFARGNGDASLVAYLAEISLFTDLDSYNQTENKVTLMTIHSAKGLEYDVVFLVGLEEGLFPLERSISEPMLLEEERRLFYVGATRARKKLYLSSASSRFRFGEVRQVPSRFIREVPDELKETIDLRSQPKWEQKTTPRRPSLFRRSGALASTQARGVHYEYEGMEGLQAGRIVHHPTFGRGKIIQIEGYGESLLLKIMFSGVGLKKIMAKYAKLKIIG